MAFLDDIHTVSMPDRVQEIHSFLEAALWSEAGIRVHQGENPSVESGWRGTSWVRRVANGNSDRRRNSHCVEGI